MGDLIYVPGRLANVFERITAAQVTVTSENAAHPKVHLIGEVNAREPWRRFYFGSAAADVAVTVDTDLLQLFGNMETNAGAGLPPGGWTELVTGSGDVTRTTTAGEFSDGVAGMKLASGSGTAIGYRDFEVRAGEVCYLAAAMLSDSGGGFTFRLQVQNLHTKSWLTAAFAWQAAQTSVFTETDGSAPHIAKGPSAFTVEPWSIAKPDGIYTLRVFGVVDAASKTCFLDGVYCHTAVDVAAVLGHKWDPSISLELRRDPTFGGAGTLEGVLPLYSPTTFRKFSVQASDRMYRFKAVGTNIAIPWYGSLFLGQGITATQKHRPEPEERFADDQDRAMLAPGVDRVTRQQEFPVRAWDLDYSFPSREAWAQFKDRVVRQTEFGRYPVLIIEDTANPESCFLARIPLAWNYKEGEIVEHLETDQRFTELGYGASGP